MAGIDNEMMMTDAARALPSPPQDGTSTIGVQQHQQHPLGTKPVVLNNIINPYATTMTASKSTAVGRIVRPSPAIEQPISAPSARRPMNQTTTTNHQITTTTQRSAAVNVVVAKKTSSSGKPPSNLEHFFVGGAEMARQRAREKERQKRKGRRGPATRIDRPGHHTMTSTQQQHQNDPKNDPLYLPLKMNTLERFFASLLRSSVHDFIASATDDTKNNNNNSKATTTSPSLWHTICRRVGVPVPTQPLASCYNYDIKSHFGFRAALVLEEARFAIAQALWTLSAMNNKKRGRNPSHSMNTSSSSSSSFPSLRVNIAASESSNTHGHIKVAVSSPRKFTNAELYHLRPGAIIQLSPSSSAAPSTNTVGGTTDKATTPAPSAVLGVVVSGNRENLITSQSFTILVFRMEDWVALFPTGSDNTGTITIVTQLVTHLRCFEAMTISQPETSIGFLHYLMGNKGPTHTRFLEDESAAENAMNTSNKKHESSKVEVISVESDSEDDYIPLKKDFGKSSSAVTPSPYNGTVVVGGDGSKSSILDIVASPPCRQNCNNSNTPSSSIGNTRKKNPYFCVPILNSIQDNAAESFLRSAPNTITLVQGPPGTGKTTLLVTILCRYVTAAMECGEECRIMVTGPTNQAVSVLANRFLETIQSNSPKFCKTILVGDADKLLTEERNSRDSNDNSVLASQQQRLQSIFLYKWIPTVMEGYERIKSFFGPRYRGPDTIPILHELAGNLERRLTQSLPHLSSDILKWTNQITSSLELLRNGGMSDVRERIITCAQKLLSDLKEMPTDTVWTELLRSANVIFSTLASSGGTVLKTTTRIDDLIIDEAAATTEPELCIPFHLRPKRLLAVGDPLQLPATVLSRRAIELGLAKSLHERLMYECNVDHVMLNVQYRMNCQISSFPSAQFYKSKIGNGPNVSGQKYVAGARLLDRLPYSFLCIQGQEEQGFGGSYCNRMEANRVADLIVDLQNMEQRSSNQWNRAERIRVITFYQAQVSLIKRCLHDRGLGNKITVATVDSSQGCEADIVILSFVRSPSDWNQRHSTAGFLTDDRRMNVALTRAKYQLICVGNVREFSRMMGTSNGSIETLHRLALDAEERGLICSPMTAQRDDIAARLDIFYGSDASSRTSSVPRQQEHQIHPKNHFRRG